MDKNTNQNHIDSQLPLWNLVSSLEIASQFSVPHQQFNFNSFSNWSKLATYNVMAFFPASTFILFGSMVSNFRPFLEILNKDKILRWLEIGGQICIFTIETINLAL